jgi:hypothetical protein
MSPLLTMPLRHQIDRDRIRKSELWSEMSEADIDLIVGHISNGRPITAIKLLQKIRGCSLHTAKLAFDSVSLGYAFVPPISSVECPSCGTPLRTELAKQCFHCGHDWH